MTDKKSYGAVSGDVVHTTDKAILIATDDQGSLKQFWIPRSVIEDGEEVEEGEALDIHVETWWLEKEGLNYG